MEGKLEEAIKYLYKNDLCSYKESELYLTNIDDIDGDGRNLLIHAVLSKNLEFVIFLLNNNSNPNIKDKMGWTPLHYAVDNYYFEITKIIIEKGAELNAKDDYGNNVIWRAVFSSKGRGEIIQLLLENGADFRIKNDSGISAYMLAERIGNYDVKKYLVDNV